MSNFNRNIQTSTVISSLFWKLMERGGTQGIQFLVQIVLARLLAPEQFGVIAIVMVFIHIAQVLVQSGFSTALIQKKNADQIDFSTIFYISFVIAAFLYLLIFFTAPIIANFYDNQLLVKVLRVLSVILFAGALNSVQNAYVAKNLMFKLLFKSSLGATVISGFVGIVLAFNGLGVWALVIQQIISHFTIAIIMWMTVKWRPSFVFSLTKARGLFSFGSKLLTSSIIDVMYMEIRTLLIGRIYSSSTLGYYNRGEQFPKLIVININGAIQSVMLPTLSLYQDNKRRVKEMMRRAIVTSSFLIFPLMIGMAIIAEPLIRVVLTDKWLPAVPFLQLFCLSYIFMPIHTANLQAINAIGRSDIYLKLEIIKKIMGVCILFISVPFGVYAIAFGQVVSGVIASFINSYPNRNLLNYSYLEQLSDLLPSAFITLIMGAIIYLLKYLNFEIHILLIVQIVMGVTIYVLLAHLLKIESYRYLVSTIRNMIKHRKNKRIGGEL